MAKSKSKSKSSVSLEKLKNFVRTRGEDYLADPNISSIGVGYKVTGGRRTNEICLQFTVKQKVQPEQLESVHSRAIPESIDIGGGERIPTDVLQRDFTTTYLEVQTETAATRIRKRRIDPVRPGVSLCHPSGTAGTFGCVVYDNHSGTPYVLSNWHVLHTPQGRVGDTIVQPGPADDNNVSANRLGALVRSHRGAPGDCAVATMEDRNFNASILELDVVPEKLGEAELGDKVIKSGRTTGVTHGIVTRIHTMTKIHYGDREVAIGGFEIGVDPAKKPANGEVSMGGDSGSVWLFKTPAGKASNVMAGLHFAGESEGNPDEYAIACYAKSVFDKLQITLTPPAAEGGTEARTGGAVSRAGFATGFLSKPVALPLMNAANQRNAVKLAGSAVIPYTHFSLALHAQRKFAIWVAWNIDGARIRKEGRSGIPFVKDPRLPANVQAGDEVYSGNRLDRGHIARRADLIWGGPAEAQQANVDSFYFTNITPQMDDFNQSSKGGLWGQLEDAVFADAKVDQLRVSVFGGPVFHDDDRAYRGIRIPREFWKVLVFVEGGVLKAKAFLLTQSLEGLEALDLPEFRVYQVPVADIEGRCGITFAPTVRTAGNRIEAVREGVRAPLGSLAEIDWS